MLYEAQIQAGREIQQTRVTADNAEQAKQLLAGHGEILHLREIRPQIAGFVEQHVKRHLEGKTREEQMDVLEALMLISEGWQMQLNELDEDGV